MPGAMTSSRSRGRLTGCEDLRASGRARGSWCAPHVTIRMRRRKFRRRCVQSATAAGIRRAAVMKKSPPSRGEYYLHLAEAWRNVGELGRALPLYEEAVRRQPDWLVARQKLGGALRLARAPDRAAAVLRPALGTAPGSYE